MKSVLDRSFKYVPAASTSLKVTFARIRRQQKAEEESRAAAEREAASKVKTLNRGKA